MRDFCTDTAIARVVADKIRYDVKEVFFGCENEHSEEILPCASPKLSILSMAAPGFG